MPLTDLFDILCLYFGKVKIQGKMRYSFKEKTMLKIRQQKDKGSIFELGDDDFELLEFHESDLALVLDVGEDSVFVEEDKFHDGAFFDEEEILSLGPGVFQRVGEQFTFIVGEELDVFVVEVLVDGGFDGGVLGVVEEEVVVDVFLVYSFPEVLVYLFQIGQCVHVRHLVLFRVVVHFVIVQLVIVLHVTVNIRLALYQQIRQHVLLLHLLHVHFLITLFYYPLKSPSNHLLINIIIEFISFNELIFYIVRFPIVDFYIQTYVFNHSDI